MTDAIRYEKGQDNIVVLTMDMPGQSANTMNAVYREAMGKIVERLEAEKDSIAGVILTSAKKTFFAGGDLKELIKILHLIHQEKPVLLGDLIDQYLTQCGVDHDQGDSGQNHD